jgi:hypothetical protein
MITKLKIISALIFLIGLFCLSASAQTTTDSEEIKRKAELEKIALERRKIALERRDVELQIRELELKHPNNAGNKPDNQKSDDINSSNVDSAVNSRNETSRNVGKSQLLPPRPETTKTSPLSSKDQSVGTNTNKPPVETTNSTQTSDDCQTIRVDQTSATRLKDAVCLIGLTISEQAPAIGNKLGTNSQGKYVTTILAAKLSTDEVTKSFFLDSEKKRTDKQVGADPKSDGTTSLVVKGGTPALIGWAVEQGAATSSFSGNTVTTRFNPLNLGKALLFNQGLLEIRDIGTSDDAFDVFLRNLSVGLSFDTTRGGETPAFTGNSNQISAISFRYEFINRRNPLAPRHKKLRDDFFFGQQANFDKIANGIFAIVGDRGDNKFRNEILNQWLDETNAELAKIPGGLSKAERRARVTAVIESQVEKLPFERLSKDPEIKDAIQSFAEGSIGFKNARDELIEQINDGLIATFEYTNFREPVAPDTSNFRFIIEKAILNKTTDLTFNASLTMYNRKPVTLNIRRIRDFQFALQTDTKLGNRFGTGDVLLSFAGRYERLNTDVVDDIGLVKPGTKGDLAFGQLKLTIPIADWGIKLPLSVTFANRTELIKESTVRANFGFTFDLDPIFGRLKPF